ncbi:armadillo-type protein [Dunaliella salina]|uniref:Armadillo-type protein n=1 Tax=Dunaliella salina TaxID=3046 RepID=A0ABQ7GPU4_DUNSA|nr:armadillo-type protein [Dunaliella salina]|eukprot:KAF5836610.1 armadillo-type protein [Dunaliella salina]
MSSKEEKPTLAGVQVKTRKRNIVVPSDPGSFSDAVVQIVQDAGENKGSEADLEAGAKALDAAELEYARYGDTLFEVFFTGGRLATGATLAEGGARLQQNILASEPKREAILPFIKVFQSLTRRRPFLIRGLENTLVKLLLSLEFFDAEGRKKIAIALALTFALKIGVLTDNIFSAMLNDRLVAKGTVLEVFTIFLQGAGLNNFVEWNVRRDIDRKVSELQETLVEMISGDSDVPPQEVLNQVKARKEEHKLPDSEVLRMIWTALIKSVNTTGKNQQQIMQAIVGKIKTYHKLLKTFATNGKLELSLLLTVQVQCYEDNRLLKLFSDIVRVLYDADIIGEDTIMFWYKKGSHAKGRNVFLKDIEPFIKWLEEAEEDADDDDE